jgi:hypothetical protein
VPRQSVAVPHSELLAKCDRHSEVIRGLVGVGPHLQKLLAELVMIRLFDEFQDALAGIALRLACGTPYVDGTAPRLLTSPSKSTASARALYENFGRPKPKYSKWSKASFINDTTKYVLDASDPFRVACSANGSVIADMQAVRNRIAHANARSREAFADVVKRHYGAKRNSVSPGTLLLSPRFLPTLLERYIVTCRVIATACAKA